MQHGHPIKLKELIPVENGLRAPFPLGKLSTGTKLGSAKDGSDPT